MRRVRKQEKSATMEVGEESREEVEAIRKVQGRAKMQGRVTKAKRAAASEDSAE